jgi:hypothetical protein
MRSHHGNPLVTRLSVDHGLETMMRSQKPNASSKSPPGIKSMRLIGIPKISAIAPAT